MSVNSSNVVRRSRSRSPVKRGCAWCIFDFRVSSLPSSLTTTHLKLSISRSASFASRCCVLSVVFRRVSAFCKPLPILGKLPPISSQAQARVWASAARSTRLYQRHGAAKHPCRPSTLYNTHAHLWSYHCAHSSGRCCRIT